LWETLKQVVKAALVGFLCWPHIRAVADLLSQRGAVPLGAGAELFFAETVATVRVTCWALIVVGLFDFAYQRRSKLLDLKMTKQEVRDEMRNSEGDPQVKGRIRSIQLAMARNKMMNDIPSASVVVTNPTHIAVALSYDPESGGAPKVVASGADALAATIRARAVEHGVPIVEAKPLARALWRACEPGDQIPIVLYEAVAKTLAFVRRIRSVTGQAPSSPMPLPGAYRVNEALLEAVPRRTKVRRRR
jgi:flagellar biosynthetic protein FlhB